MVGREIRMIQNALTIEFSARKTQFVEVDCAISCILHANNRTPEKLLWMMLVTENDMRHSKMERDEFKSKVEQTTNIEIFGKMEFKELGQWRVPLEGQAQVIGKVKLSCMDTNKLIDKLVLIVEVCAEKLSVDKQADRKNCAELYASVHDA